MIDVGELFRLSWTQFKLKWKVIATATLFLYLIPSIITSLLLLQLTLELETAKEFSFEILVNHFPEFTIAMVLGISAYLIYFPTIIIILQSKKGTFLQMLQKGIGRVKYELTATIVIFVLYGAILLLILALVVVGIIIATTVKGFIGILLAAIWILIVIAILAVVVFYWGTKIGLTHIVAIAQEKHGITALRDAYLMSDGHWLSLIVGFSLAGVGSIVINAPVSILTFAVQEFAQTTAVTILTVSILSSIAYCISLPFGFIVTYFTYDLIKRIKKE
ncbi:MAG TPA: hypothetical protein VK158_03700 [Acidobacteriota bacterium]|nr:hypothetical protein [Acidobacteriota bacterium]